MDNQAASLPTAWLPVSFAKKVGGARTRTPMFCCASSFPKGRGSISSPDARSSECRRCSTIGPAGS